ncbi:MAG: type I-U CRISPR-associated protein Csb2 [Thermodesulfobacteriota bacterium]
MPTLILRFPGRRYHATPWGHHVNEGLVEWPPSPWRLLRALLAVGYSSGLWDGSGLPPEARSLIERLASVLPTFRLPPASGAHSRHYMPLARLNEKGQEEKTLVFDTWAQIDEGELAITWDVDLPPAEADLLGQLARRLGYLGRSESWVVARLSEEPASAMSAGNSFPADGRAMPGPGWEQVSLLAPQPSDDYAEWRRTAAAHALEGLPTLDPAKKKLTKADRKILEDRGKLEAMYPEDIVACLQITTNWLHDLGWSQPPGSRRVLYWRPADAVEAGAPRQTRRTQTEEAVECMLLAMATGSRNDHALPPVIRTLPQAELLHRALVKVADQVNGHPSSVLTGRDAHRQRLTDAHRHAHILPLDLDGDGHLEHFLIWAPMGLDGAAQTAIRAVRQTFTRGGVGPLRLAVAGRGDLSSLGALPGAYGDGLRLALGPPGGAREWWSVTPFVPPRHMKRHGKHTLEGQIEAELVSRGRPKPALIMVLDPREDPAWLRFRHFSRVRRGGPAPPVDWGFAVRLCFDVPVTGPICLGYASHFGLGRFTAVRAAIGREGF